MISGRHPAGMDYKFTCDNPPLHTKFDDIVWPPDWERPWEQDDKLRQNYGEPFYERGNSISLNEAYWAGLYATENQILYEPNEKGFYRYNPETGLYEPESNDAIRTKSASRILEASRQMNAFELQTLRSASTLNNVTSHLRGIVERRGVFSQKKKMIHLANGVLVFNAETNDFDLYPFSPEFYSRNRSPIAFDPNARCDQFLNELILPAVAPEDAELLQKFAGMFLLGHNRAQRFLVLDGEAGRGKSQFAIVIQGVVGQENCTQLRTKHLGERFELYRFLFKTMAVGVDVEPDFLRTKGAAVLKGLVGGDWFDAEQKGGTGSFPFQGNFNVIITSNARLRVRLQGDVGAWKRRLCIVRYELPPPKKIIPDFGTYLVKKEGSGILNWALAGARKLLKEMPNEGGDFQLTPRQHKIVDSLLAESESLRHFLMDKVVADSGSDLLVSEIVEAYAAYCPEKHWQALPITELQGQLKDLMLELFGVTQSHDIEHNGMKGRRGFRKVRMK